MADTAMLVDTSKCTGCRGCQIACKEWNDLGASRSRLMPGTYQNPPAIAANSWTVIRFSERVESGAVRWLFRKEQCLHCGQASCTEVCPTGAMAKQADGFVEVDQNWCIGCRYCVQACPFGAVQFDPASGTVKKCTLCLDRVQAGLAPACVKTCPAGALTFGDRGKLLGLAEARVAALRQNGQSRAQLYGNQELGGLKVMYVLGDAPAAYGLAENPPVATRNIAADWLSGAAATVLLATLPFYWVVRRRRALAEQEPVSVAGGERDV